MNHHEDYIPFLKETIQRLEAKVVELENMQADKLMEVKARWLLTKRNRQLLDKNEELVAEIRQLKKGITRVWLEGRVG